MLLPTDARSGSHSAPRVGMRVGDRLLSAVPVHLDGHRASLRFEDRSILDGSADIPSLPAGRTHLHLDWADGSVTELSVEVRSTDAPERLAHVDIHAVNGDWRQFLAYLARHA